VASFDATGDFSVGTVGRFNPVNLRLMDGKMRLTIGTVGISAVEDQFRALKRGFASSLYLAPLPQFPAAAAPPT
jgi:hypothetical protein